LSFIILPFFLRRRIGASLVQQKTRDWLAIAGFWEILVTGQRFLPTTPARPAQRCHRDVGPWTRWPDWSIVELIFIS